MCKVGTTSQSMFDRNCSQISPAMFVFYLKFDWFLVIALLLENFELAYSGPGATPGAEKLNLKTISELLVQKLGNFFIMRPLLKDDMTCIINFLSQNCCNCFHQDLNQINQ